MVAALFYLLLVKDGLNWELAYQDLSGEPYMGDIISYMGRLYLTTYNKGRVYSSADGRTWTAVSNKYIDNNTSNSLIGDLQVFKDSIDVTTRNAATGTQIWKAKVE